MGLELVREFDKLTKKFYSTTLDYGQIEWGEAEIYVGIRTKVRKEMYLVLDTSYPITRPNKNEKVGKFETLLHNDNDT
jgi:hypothetical protein